MTHSINPTAIIYTLGGTQLMQCQFVSQTDTAISVLVSMPEFLQLSGLHESVLLVLTSPTLGLLPHICILRMETVFRTDKDKEQNIQIQFIIQERKDPIQRRREFKVKTCIDVDIRLLTPRSGRCKGRIEDLCAAGILLATEEELDMRQKFIFSPSESVHIPKNLHAKVIRVQGNNKIKRYGCRLQNLSLSDEELLRQFVFKTDAQNHHHDDTE